jgi:ribosome-associated translation inhibitor RaiA
MKNRTSVSLSNETLTWLTKTAKKVGLSRSALLDMIVRATRHQKPEWLTLLEELVDEIETNERREKHKLQSRKDNQS